ncbi:MAG: type II toxin-antitoxin system HicB family antitoxin [Planctomycetes bacterium]|nr:type II toxin-antitoxin system HicB family antitoxin [Planctomycetota bacterium]
MKKVQYLVRINKDPESDWGASVPDLPGCVSTGKTIDSALRRIQEAILLHIKGMLEDGIKPTPPRVHKVIPRKTSRQIDFFAIVEVAA